MRNTKRNKRAFPRCSPSRANLLYLKLQTQELTDTQRANVYAFLAGAYAQLATENEFADTVLDAIGNAIPAVHGASKAVEIFRAPSRTSEMHNRTDYKSV
jgi:hypothetical protein